MSKENAILVAKHGEKDFAVYEYCVSTPLDFTQPQSWLPELVEQFESLEDALKCGTERKTKHGIEYIDVRAMSRVEHITRAKKVIDWLISEGFEAGPDIGSNIRILRDGLVEIRVKLLENLAQVGETRRQDDAYAAFARDDSPVGVGTGGEP